MTTEALKKEVLKLSKSDQLLLAQSLLQSISQENGHLSDAHLAEANRRLEEIENGSVKTIPADQVFAELREKYAPKS